MNNHKLMVLAAFLSLLGCAQTAGAEESVSASQMQEINSSSPERVMGSFDFGLGLSLEPLPDDFSLGWDLLFGYEWKKSDNWNMGLQLHYQRSLFSDKPYFQTVGVFATARPENRWFRWLQFKAGLVSDDYYTTVQVVDTTPYYSMHNEVVSWNGTGFALGSGIVEDMGSWRLHWLDMERHFVAGHSFSLYTISVLAVGKF